MMSADTRPWMVCQNPEIWRELIPHVWILIIFSQDGAKGIGILFESLFDTAQLSRESAHFKWLFKSELALYPGYQIQVGVAIAFAHTSSSLKQAASRLQRGHAHRSSTSGQWRHHRHHRYEFNIMDFSRLAYCTISFCSV